MTVAIEGALFCDAMRLTASGVSVITSEGDAGKAGVTVSTLCSLSLEPPSVMISIKRENYALAVLMANGTFTANVLSERQARVADAFAGLLPQFRSDRFASANWRRLANGSLVLDGALCAFDCRVATSFEFGSHRIIVGEVLDLEVGSGAPLIHSNRTYYRLIDAKGARQ
jgi:flavin reductase (DIM6/NTAB) family NADH-FMN oxidoreductase RutF